MLDISKNESALLRQVLEPQQQIDKVILLERINSMLDKHEENDYLYQLLISLNTADAAQIVCNKLHRELNTTARCRYLRILGNFKGNPLIFRSLIRELPSPDNEIRRETINALGKANIFRSTPFLINMLEQNNTTVRNELIRSLGRIGGKYTATIIEKNYPFCDIQGKREALFALSEIRSRDSAAVAFSALESEEPALINPALTCLAKIGLKDEIPRLKTFRDSCDDLRFKRLATRTIEQMQANSDLNLETFIGKIIGLNDLTHLEEQIKVLRLFPSSTIRNLLDNLIKDPSVMPSNKRNLLRIFRIVRNCHEVLLSYFQIEADPQLRKEAIRVLGYLRIREYLPFYQKLHAYETQDIQKELMIAISKLENRDILGYFMNMLVCEEDLNARLESIRAIKNLFLITNPTDIDKERLEATLKQVLLSDDPAILRARVAWIAGELKFTSLSQAIIKFVKEEVDHKYWAYWSLAQLGDQASSRHLTELLQRSDNKRTLAQLVDCLIEAQWFLPFPLLHDLYKRIDPAQHIQVMHLMKFCTDPDAFNFFIEQTKGISAPLKVEVLKIALMSNGRRASKTLLLKECLKNETNLFNQLIDYLEQVEIDPQIMLQLLTITNIPYDTLLDILESWIEIDPDLCLITIKKLDRSTIPLHLHPILERIVMFLTVRLKGNTFIRPISDIDRAASVLSAKLKIDLYRVLAENTDERLIASDRDEQDLIKSLLTYGIIATLNDRYFIREILPFFQDDYLIQWFNDNEMIVVEKTKAKFSFCCLSLQEHIKHILTLFISMVKDRYYFEIDKAERLFQHLGPWVIVYGIFSDNFQIKDRVLPSLLHSPADKTALADALQEFFQLCYAESPLDCALLVRMKSIGEHIVKITAIERVQ